MADRPRIRTYDYARLYPDRIVVIGDANLHRPWWVWRGTQDISTHATHAEAITAATELARQHARDTGFPLAG